ncbi:Nuclear matrix protein 1 [Hibiscus syriacus]|uniref:Nuclear matrix protein 1 n=1 Tax=Hibiscus syriacus TaxID=106335 RepID=A0A6A3B5G1_HIBSY|nr:Nuclear matrix protein 1 [Hibiscus syriacus]
MTSVFFAILVLSSTLCLIDAHNGGFSVELIHRDSVKSPFYNPSETTFDRISNALHRSFNRVNHFRPNSVSTKEAEAEIIVNSGEYLMNISLGTPAFDIVAIADTGSDLIWTQCKPCSQCFTQEAPLFDPSKSSTYRKLSCTASQCGTLHGSSCSGDSCQYQVGYGDRSFSRGDLAADTLNLASTTGRSVAVPKTVIGCGFENGGTFNEKRKFSYCLLPISETGKSTKMNFGSNAVVSGPGVVSTPLVKKTPDTFYYLTLEAISVGNKRIELSSTGSVPPITVHFTDADVELKPMNTFVMVSDTTVCFTFTSNSDFAIYGNLAQMNFLVGYDTEKQTYRLAH